MVPTAAGSPGGPLGDAYTLSLARGKPKPMSESDLEDYACRNLNLYRPRKGLFRKLVPIALVLAWTKVSFLPCFLQQGWSQESNLESYAQKHLNRHKKGIFGKKVDNMLAWTKVRRRRHLLLLYCLVVLVVDLRLSVLPCVLSFVFCNIFCCTVSLNFVLYLLYFLCQFCWEV